MSLLKVVHQIKTLDNHVLLPAGTVVTERILEDLVASNRAAEYRTCPILRYGLLSRHLDEFLTHPPFSSIFSDRALLADTIALMENVTLPVPFLDSLDYFRTHDFYTYRHILVVFALSTLLAKDLIPDYDIEIATISTSPTHDIGKICVPPAILKKTTPLTRGERDILMNHTTAGYILGCYYLGDIQHMSAVVARDHHERRDGSGHPRGVLLDDLLVEIIAACDVYDALISPRPYRPVSFDNRTALEEITAMAEQNRIRWDVVRALVSYNRTEKGPFSDRPVSKEKRGAPPENNLYGTTIEEEGTDHP